MGVYTESIQKLYVAYFSRPADAAGLLYWEGVVAAAKGNTDAVSAAFAGSAEYKAAYADKSAAEVINTVYLNLFGREAEASGVDYWAPLLAKGALTIDVVVTAVAGGARGADLLAYSTKVSAAMAFTSALTSPSDILGYAGADANAKAVAFLAGITDYVSLSSATGAAALAAAVTAVTDPAVKPLPLKPVTAIVLGASADQLIGTAAADLFTATAATFNAGDRISGGAGIDTLAITDSATLTSAQLTVTGSGMTLSSVENVTVSTSGDLLFEAQSWTGVTSLVARAAGKNIVVGAPAASAVSVVGAAVEGGGVFGGHHVTIDNPSPTGASGQGTTMLAAVLHDFAGNATVKGAALAGVYLANISHDASVTVVNSTPAHPLLVMLDNVGYAGETAQYPSTVTVVDPNASIVRIDYTKGDSAVSLAASSATTVELVGAPWMYFDPTPAVSTRLTTIDGSAATGNIRLANLGSFTHTIATGAGDDKFTLTTATARDNPATAANESVTANVTMGAGDDDLYMRTSGDGKVNVDTGADKDAVYLMSRSGSETLAISMGAGNDWFDANGVAVRATDSIDGGEGIFDALRLDGVTATNIGAFSGFEMLEVSRLDRALDIGGLMAKNAVGFLYTWGNVGAARLLNVGQDIHLGAWGDMEGSTMDVNLAVRRSIEIWHDIDESTADVAADTATASFSLYNASIVSAVFRSDFQASVAGEVAAGDNVATLNLATKTVTSLSVDSGGTFANNVLNHADLTSTLAQVFVNGAQKLALNVTSTRLDVIDASAHAGGLTVSTASLANAGTIRLGAGVDTVTVAANSGTGGFETLSGLEKAAVVIGSTSAANTAAIADADTMILAGARVANAASVSVGGIASTVSAYGVLSFGTVPATIATAFLIADAATDAGEVLVFQYMGDSYVFMQGANDIAVKLSATIGITGIAETGNDAFFIV